MFFGRISESFGSVGRCDDRCEATQNALSLSFVSFFVSLSHSYLSITEMTVRGRS